jgi:hypothetical protein
MRNSKSCSRLSCAKESFRAIPMHSVLPLLGWLFYIGLPAMIIWGWVRWTKLKTTQAANIGSMLSLASFALASVSVALAISSVLYAHFRPFPYYDPVLMKIFAAGGLLSLASVTLSLGGVWRKNPLRWLAPVCGIGTLIFWFASAMGE